MLKPSPDLNASPAPEPDVPAVRVEGLGYRYPKHVALDGVTLSVPGVSLFALLGPKGSGKTTFFRILSTALHPGAGSASIYGHDLEREPAAVRRRIGVVFQAPSLDGKLTVQENLRFHGLLFGWRGAALRDRAAEMLALFGLEERRRERVETSPVASSGASSWPRLCSRDRPCCCWTSPRRAWPPRRGGSSGGSSSACGRSGT